MSIAKAAPEPAGWFTGDIHVHRNCGGSPILSVSSIYNDMVSQDLNVVSLLADMGNGEVLDPAEDLPKVTGQDDTNSTPGRIIHWDAEWHWDATYTQFSHQALGGHILALGITNATQIWNESTYPILNWARQQGGIAGFAHFQYLDDNIPQTLTCCTPIEYPVEVALGACDFISEDVNGSESFIRSYYRLLNCGFRPGFAAGSDHPCAASIGTMLTYSQVAGGQLTYRNWINGIKNGRTVVSRNGRREFLDLKVNNTAGPGDEIQLAGAGSVQVNVQWLATQNLTGTIELVQNGVVVASQPASVSSGSPATLSTTVNFTKSGWLCARRMNAAGHQVHTAAMFVIVGGAPVRASAADAQFYVQWMDTLLQNTSVGGVWASYFPTGRAAAQARYTAAKNIFQQVAVEAGAGSTTLPPVSIGNGNDGSAADGVWFGGAWINAGRFLAASNMTVTAMEAKVAGVSGKYKCAIYTDSAGQPSRLLRSSVEVVSPSTGWQTFPLTASQSLTNGQYYWLSIWSDDANAQVYYSGNNGTLNWGQYNYGNWPDPITISSGGNLNYCIYATGSGTVGTLTNIVVAPATSTILAGATQQFTATGAYSDGSAQNITSLAVWASSNSAVATIGVGGLATGASAGTATISATLAGKAGSATLTVQAAPLSINTTSLPDGVVNTAYSTTIAASDGKLPYAWLVSGGALPSGLLLNSASGAITGTPTVTGTFNYTAQVKDSSSPTQTVTRSFTLNILTAPTVVTIWPSALAPVVADGGADSPVTLGVKFRSDAAGSITGIRFYKSSANTGTHIGGLWDSAGTLLGSASFSNETGSGWQQVFFAAPIPIAANTIYVASYHTTVGHYSADVNYFASSGVDNVPLHALAGDLSGGNGVYAYGSSPTFPNSTWNAANYWVDVVFQPGTAPVLTNIAVTPTNPTLGVGASQQFTATGSYSDGSSQNLTSLVTWTSANTTVATNSGGGLLVAGASGSTIISASVGSVTGGTTLTVSAPATLTSIVVTPGNATNVVGGVQQFTATGNYSDSSTQNLTGLATWTSSNASVAMVSASGLASGIAAGVTTIAATVTGVTGSTALTVTLPPEGLGDYRSIGNGLWNSAATWQTNNGTTWVTATRPPTNNASVGVVTIRNGHTVTVSTAASVDQMVVQTGGQITVSNVTLTVANGAGTDLDVSGTIVLTGNLGTISAGSGAAIVFKGGSTYQHARATGTIPAATWDTNATCLITGITTAVPSGLGQIFGHFTWNCTGQTAALNLEASMNVAGNFTVSSTGSSTLRIADGSTAREVTVGGNFTQPAGTFVVASGTSASTLNVGGNFNLGGGTFTLKDSSGAAALNVTGNFNQTGGAFNQRTTSTTSTAIVTVARHFTLTSGTYNLSGIGAVGILNLGGNLVHTGGTLTETSSGSGAVVFTTGLHTNTSGGTVSSTVNFTVNSGATLMLGASLLGNGSSGTFTLAAGGTLGIGDAAGITSSGAAGNIRVTGTRSYNTVANYLYHGTTAQVTGNGLPATLNNLTIANPAGLTLNTTNIVTGNCQVSANGRLLGAGRITSGPLLLNGVLSPGVGVGRLTTAREVWNGGASYSWELNNAAGIPGSGWDLLSLTNGQGIDLQAMATNRFALQLVTLNGSNPGLATGFSKTNSYLWTIAVATNAAITNFSADKFLINTTQFSNDFGAGTFSLEQAGSELRLRFIGEPVGLTIITTSLSNALHNMAYATTVSAVGGASPYSWFITNSTLPTGLVLNPTNGAITGTAASAGGFNFTIGVRDSSNPKQTATKSFSLTVAPTLTSVAVTPVNPTNVIGTTRQFTATGTYSDGSAQNLTSLATWTSSSNGVASINSGGLATGTTVGVTTISATMGSVSGNTTLRIQPTPLTIATTPLADGTVNVPYGKTLTASGGVTPYVWSLANGALPSGLTLNSGGSIVGTPTTAGSFNIAVRVTDAGVPAQAVTNLFVLVINSSNGTPGIFGNTADGTLTDSLWFNGPWINANRILAASNTLVSMIQAKVVGIAGKYKCAIYTDSGGFPNQLLRSTTEISNLGTGWQTLPLTSSVVLTNGQYYWLAIWSDNTNAQVYYSGNNGTLRWQQVNYGNWPDPLAAAGDGTANYCIYATGVGSIYFGVASTTPMAGATGVGFNSTASATFTVDMETSTINGTTVALRDPSGNLVSASISYNSGNRTVTLIPNAALKSATTYTATIKGGASGVTSLAGTKLLADFTWSFTTDIYGDGPGGPILVLTQTTNAFSRYYAEILLAEGLNAFALTNVSSISAAALANYDVVILGQTALTTAQMTILSNWVSAGGKLIAMRPDKQLAGLLGLVDAGTTLSEGYMLVNTTNGPGVGIARETMQFHGTADRYTLGSATRIATLYSSATATTVNPAVTLRNVGSNGGQASAFTYDLAKSVIYTRQGNPAWAGQERDGLTPQRSDDLFYGAASFDPQPDWVNLNKVAIPQADEQQRLLVNLIISMNSSKKLLPRFWYFPHGYPAAVVMTGDDHANDGTPGRFDQYMAASASGASVGDWQAVRATSYVFPNPLMTDAQAVAYNAAGFEIGLHVNSDCNNYTAETLSGFFSQQMAQFRSAYPSLATPTTLRMHCIAWSGYTTLPEVSANYGIKLDTSYYYYPPAWVANRPGMFTGSGMAMRFATTNGATINVFQAATQMTDESDQSYPFTVDTLLDRALGPEGYYGAFVANMHTDYNTPSTPGKIGSDAILSSAQSRGIPIITAKHLLTWVDARNNSSIQAISWNGSSQNFSVAVDAAAKGLMSLTPVPPSYTVSEVRFNGSPIDYSLVVVKGIRYALFYATNGNYQVLYAQDSTPPGVTAVVPASGAMGVSPTAEIRISFSEALDVSTVNNSTIVLFDQAANPVTATVTYNPSTHTAVLQPNNVLQGSKTYTVGVESGATGIKDFAGNPMTGDFIWVFTTTNQTSYSLWGGSTVPGLVDAGADSPVQLGVKFQSDVAGYITGIRFYKASANIGTHVGSLWNSAGTRLAVATFSNETVSGWQQVNFAPPVAISANTIYVASYHTTGGHYSADTGYFTSVGIDNGVLYAPASGTSGGNGVYGYGDSTVFPGSTWNAANYWVDVLFQVASP